MYNCEKYIERTLNSILSQSFSDFELILVNDGSTDNTLKICEEYAKQDPRIIILSKVNGGVCSARNLGIRNASGKYITMIDSDDTIEPNTYKSIYNHIINSEPDMLEYPFMTYHNNERYSTFNQNKHPKGILLDRKYILNNIALQTINGDNKYALSSSSLNKFYKRLLIINNNIFFEENRKRYEDKLFVIEVLHKSNNMLFSNEGQYNYIKRPNSLVSLFVATEIYYITSNYLRYVQLWGNEIEISTATASKYWVSVFEDIVLRAMLRKSEFKNKHEFINIMFTSTTVKEWYTLLQTDSQFQLKIKNAILDQNYNKAYILFLRKSFPLRVKKIIKNLLFK